MTAAPSNNQAVLYLLLTYGRKHSRVALIDRPGVRKQVVKIQWYAKNTNLELDQTAFDYVRDARSLSDFEVLSKLLKRCASHADAPTVVVADLLRFLTKFPIGSSDSFLIDLAPYFAHVHDATLGRRLDTVGFEVLQNYYFAANRIRANNRIIVPRPLKSKPERCAQTESARRTSTFVQTLLADNHAKSIAQLRDELAKQDPEWQMSLSGLARAANERGLLTRRGNKWNAAGIRRALARTEHG